MAFWACREWGTYSRERQFNACSRSTRRCLYVAQCVRCHFNAHNLSRLTRGFRRWSPQKTLRHCLVNTECKLIIVDPERADVLEPIAKKLAKEAGAAGILVLESHEGKGNWTGMKTWESAMKGYKGDHRKILKMDPGVTPEDNSTIIFTSGMLVFLISLDDSILNLISGTTGMPKGVLSSQRQFLTNTLNVSEAF